MKILWVRGHELEGFRPERCDSRLVFRKGDGEAVLLAGQTHELEWIVFDVAIETDAGFDSPIPLVLVEELLLPEEAGVESVSKS